MKTNRFDDNKYDIIFLTLGVFIPFTLLFLMMMTLLESKTEYRHGERYIVEPYSTILLILIGLIVLFFIAAILFAIIGKIYVRKYALQLINYEDDDAIEDVWVNADKVYVAYHEDGEKDVTEVDLKFYCYKIKKKVRSDIDYPIFYLRNGLIHEVYIPFSKEEDKKWREYEVR